MAGISMRNVRKSSASEYFDLSLSSSAARGVEDKTLRHTISISAPLSKEWLQPF